MIQFGVWNFGRAGMFVNMYLRLDVHRLYDHMVVVSELLARYCGEHELFRASTRAGPHWYVTLWFVEGRIEWDGPNKAVFDYVLRNES